MTDFKIPTLHAPKGKDIRHIFINIETVFNKNFLQRYKNIFRNKPSSYTKWKLRKNYISNFSISPVAKPLFFAIKNKKIPYE